MIFGIADNNLANYAVPKKMLYLGALDIASSSSEANFVLVFALLPEETSEVP